MIIHRRGAEYAEIDYGLHVGAAFAANICPVIGNRIRG